MTPSFYFMKKTLRRLLPDATIAAPGPGKMAGSINGARKIGRLFPCHGRPGAALEWGDYTIGAASA
jgi:hypothetical protein